MRHFVIYLAFITAALAQPHGYSWNPAPLPVDVTQGKIDLVLTGEVPTHWALTVLPAKGDTAGVSAASVDLDGPSIERVSNLPPRRLHVSRGVVRIQSDPNEAGLALCVTVPAGARVRVMHEEVTMGSFPPGTAIRDGVRGGSNPKTCTSVAALQLTILGR